MDKSVHVATLPKKFHLKKKNLTATSCIKTRLHCKLPVQSGGATWPRSLVEQLKSPGVNDKLTVLSHRTRPISFIEVNITFNSEKYSDKMATYHEVIP